MSGFSPDEVEEFEEVRFQNEKEARLNYLTHGQPLSRRHKLYLQEKERQKRGGSAGSAYGPVSQATPGQETYQQQNYQTCNPVRQAGPSTYEAANENYPRGYATGGPQAYSVASPDEQPLPDDGAYSVYAPSSTHSQDVGYYNSPSLPPLQSQPSRQTSVMKTMMLRGDNKRNIQMWSAKGSWQGLKAILDDGTEGNWISKKAADRLNLPITDGLRKDYTTFEGKRISSVASTEVSWCLDGWSTTEATIFRVAEGPNTPFDVLFGRNIISSGEIDFWGESNPIQVLTETDVQPREQQDILQKQYAVQLETDRIEEQRRQRNANQHRQEGRDNEKPWRGSQKDKRSGHGDKRRK